MDTSEMVKRLRIGSALGVGFVLGRFLATEMGHHASEFFIGGFGLGVVLTQGLYWAVDRLAGKNGPG
ncbi:hypothetical protein SAMN02949497_0695 [Methylomagnum ishizawai]|uniref:Uncharacterized protein n=1 Tax=Methylomagnum ishizawai TaxID=1760988 RepID=A0A1Y6CZ08_9GAMM|nr:hypothetical protein [Methylomagnum ishizawai]SMF93414.1 hypothetical protein SAMN02949497_0695 [Methylomagnum ishizawai]